MMLKLSEFAQDLNISERKARQLCKEGMPHLVVPGCGIRINFIEAVRWISMQSASQLAAKNQAIRNDLRLRKKALRSVKIDRIHGEQCK